MRVERVVQRPWVEAGEFTFTPALSREIVAEVLRNPKLRQAGVPPSFLLFNRLQWGLYAVLIEMRASGRFRPIVAELLDDSERPSRWSAALRVTARRSPEPP